MPRRHAPVADSSSGKHFVPARTDVKNNRSPLNPFPGDLTYKSDPTLELDFALWEDNGSSMSAKEGVSMTMFGLYKEAMAKEFIVADRVRMAWKPDPAGRLTFNGQAGGNTATPAMVLMWRTGAEADSVEAASDQLKQSAEIQTSVEDKIREKAAGYIAATGNDDIRIDVQYADEKPQTFDIGEDEE
jgi:hypothetical protein